MITERGLYGVERDIIKDQSHWSAVVIATLPRS